MIKKIAKEIVDDTLKKIVNGSLRWSRTSLTMFSAWCISIYMVFYMLCKEGFRYDVFVTMVGVALGSKLTDAIGQKIISEKTKPDEEVN